MTKSFSGEKKLAWPVCKGSNGVVIDTTPQEKYRCLPAICRPAELLRNLPPIGGKGSRCEAERHSSKSSLTARVKTVERLKEVHFSIILLGLGLLASRYSSIGSGEAKDEDTILIRTLPVLTTT